MIFQPLNGRVFRERQLFKLSTFPTSADFPKVTEPVVNIFDRRKMEFLMLSSSSVKSNNDFQLFFKNVKNNVSHQKKSI